MYKRQIHMSMKRSRLLLSITIIFFWASEYCHAPYFTPYLQTLGFTATAIGVKMCIRDRAKA